MPSSSFPQPRPGADWPSPCRAFFEHWKSLRGEAHHHDAHHDSEHQSEALMPTTEHFMDHMDAAFVSNLYITDVTSLGSIVRYQGSELQKRWGVDLTDQEMAAHRPPELRRQLHNVMNIVAGYPCGYFSASRFLSSLQRLVDVYIVRLPLSVQPGRPYRTVNFTTQNEGLSEQEFAAHGFETVHSAWFDIGAGIPAQAPERMRM